MKKIESLYELDFNDEEVIIEMENIAHTTDCGDEGLAIFHQLMDCEDCACACPGD
ncbi:MAG: hypothetical protein QG588_21 [Candidatus Poribacteria bacterium]|nr:hypothetical protein [Candidatus Poribacteria bacterium]